MIKSGGETWLHFCSHEPYKCIPLQFIMSPILIPYNVDNALVGLKGVILYRTSNVPCHENRI